MVSTMTTLMDLSFRHLVCYLKQVNSEEQTGKDQKDLEMIIMQDKHERLQNLINQNGMRNMDLKVLHLLLDPDV